MGNPKTRASRKEAPSKKGNPDAQLELGVGEYEFTDDHGDRPSIVHLRSFFLEEARKARQGILRDLGDKIFPLYRKIPLVCFEADLRRTRYAPKSSVGYGFYREPFSTEIRPSWYEIEKAWEARDKGEPFAIIHPEYYGRYRDGGMLREECPPHDDPKIEQLVRLMCDWSKSNFLDASWCRHHAFETLDLWSAKRELIGRCWQPLPLNLITGTVEIPALTPNEIDFETAIQFDLSEQAKKLLIFYPTYGQSDSIWSEMGRLEKEVDRLKENLKGFLNKRDREARRTKGLKPSINKKSLEHIKWFARIQMGKETYTTISTKYYAAQRKIHPTYSPSNLTAAIRGSVTRVSNLIGLKLPKNVSRPGPRGPRK